jgi:transposase-like protein
VSPAAVVPPHPPPSHCPFCRATTIRTASEKADVTSYWRCEQCGEVWNADRLPAVGRGGFYRRVV